MKSNRSYRSLSMVTGLIVTILFLLIAGPKLIGSIIKDPWQIPGAFLDWHDDPTSFFLTYFIGYAIVWWKPLWGTLIIFSGCMVYFFFNLDTLPVLMFIIPAMMVAVFYLLYWKSKRSVETSDPLHR